MPVITTPKTMKVCVNVSNGSTATGGIRTLSVNLGKLNPENYDAAKVWAIV